MFFRTVGIIVSLLSGVNGQNVGRFWHVTDFHYDHTYWTSQLSCNEVVPNPGEYGDYWCDSPWILVQDSINSMAEIQSDVDFMLWTGDTVAHIKDANLSLDINMEIIQNITDALTEKFPNKTIYATLGNHDFYPSGQAKPEEDELYRRVGKMWEDWIKNQTQVELFEGGGYYTSMINPKLRLLALNTNFYYTSDKLTGEMEDPAGQFAWMKSQLEEAKTKGEKVMLTAHVPPGLKTPGLADWFYPEHKTKFVATILEYSDIIVGTHFGHDHSDGFKILQNSDGTKAVTQFTAPSVTPWRYKIPQETGEAHNPGIRLVEYDRDTGRQLNYHQYYINLTDTNNQGQANWTKLYTFTEAYDVEDMTVTSLRKIFSNMEKDGESPYFHKYCKYSLVSSLAKPCTQQMRSEIYCAGLNHVKKDVETCATKYVKGLNAASSIVINGFLIMMALMLFAARHL